MNVCTDRRWRHSYKTKISRIDGLPYFLNNDAPRARLRLDTLDFNISFFIVFCFSNFVLVPNILFKMVY